MQATRLADLVWIATSPDLDWDRYHAMDQLRLTFYLRLRMPLSRAHKLAIWIAKRSM